MPEIRAARSNGKLLPPTALAVPSAGSAHREHKTHNSLWVEMRFPTWIVNGSERENLTQKEHLHTLS